MEIKGFSYNKKRSMYEIAKTQEIGKTSIYDNHIQ